MDIQQTKRLALLSERETDRHQKTYRNANLAKDRLEEIIYHSPKRSKIFLDSNLDDLIEGCYSPSLKASSKIEGIFNCLNDIYTYSIYSNVSSPKVFVFNEDGEKVPIPYAALVTPLLQYTFHHLDENIDISFLDFETKENIKSVWAQEMAQRILKISNKTMILEMHIAKISDSLQGNTSVERFTNFSTSYLEKNIIEIFHNYPLLAKALIESTNHYIRNITSFLKHLKEDITELQSYFGVNKLRTIKFSGADLHNKGKKVVFLEFMTGEKIVYKPRSLAVDVCFNNFLSSIKKIPQNNISLRTIKSIDKGTHGWCEFINYEACASKQDIEDFYYHQGQIIAILYSLNAADFHYENLIAQGKNPVLVDLECLLQNSNINEDNNDRAIFKANRILDDSVVRIGLLPLLMYGQTGRKGIDISGLGGQEGQVTPYDVPTIKDPFTDEMRLEPASLEMAVAENLPRYQGSFVKPEDYIENILDGFNHTFRWITKYKTSYSEMVELNFENCQVRHLARSTRRYADLISNLEHPDSLQDSVDAEILIENLWIEVNSFPWLAHLFSYEKDSLLRGDIPFFENNVSKNSLLVDGQEIKGYFKQPALQKALQKIKNLSIEDGDFQSGLIKASFASIAEPYKDNQNYVISYNNVIDEEEVLEEAIKIADIIVEQAILGDKDITWIGSSIEGVEGITWNVSPVSHTIYDGACGIALALLYIDKFNNDKRYKSIIERIIYTTMSVIKESDSFEEGNVGPFSGVSSMLYLLSHIAHVYKDQQLIEECHLLATKLTQVISQDKNFGILDGAAGLIIVAKQLFHISQQQVYLDIVKACADHLYKSAVIEKDQFSWVVASSTNALGGFSHGTAGIAWALLEANELLQSQKLADAIWGALNYDRHLFVNSDSNWKDARSIGQISPCSVAWCHGAPGIGLSRILMKKQGWTDNIIDQEISIATSTTLEKFYGSSDSLCHGSLGNISILNTIAKYTKNQELLDNTKSAFNFTVLESKKRGSWRLGVPRYANAPGLMLGQAGIALGLVKTLDIITGSDIIPDILSLEMPS